MCGVDGFELTINVKLQPTTENGSVGCKHWLALLFVKYMPSLLKALVL